MIRFQINLTLLQVSIIEDIISFSALDNVKDLTCVSLFSVSLDNITAKLHFDKQVSPPSSIQNNNCTIVTFIVAFQRKEILQTVHRPAVVQMGSKKVLTKAKAFLLGQHSNTIADIIRGEPVTIETCESQQDQLVVCLNVGRLHAQLRRLHNESSILDDAVITAIPGYFSKVLFACGKTGPIYRGVDYYLRPVSPQSGDSSSGGLPAEFGNEDKLGFIMFEGGLEGVVLKVVKRSQFEQGGGGEPKALLPPPPPPLEGGVGEPSKSRQDIPSAAIPEGAKPNSTPKSQKSAENLIPGKEPADENQPKVAAATAAKDTGNISSCIIELKVVWFNFAAPPRAPITRKIDYTR